MGYGYYDAQKFIARHFVNDNYHIQGIDFDQPYSPVAYDDLFRINIVIAYMHRLTARVLDVRSYIQNINIPIHERVFPYHHPIIWTDF